MTKQLNIRLPETTIDRINQLAKIYGSQAKAVIAAVEHLHTKEIEMYTTQDVAKMLGKVSLETALNLVGEPTDDAYISDVTGNEWTEPHDNGTVVYQFSDDEIAHDDDDSAWAENLPWDNDHIVRITLTAESVSGTWQEDVWLR